MRYNIAMLDLILELKHQRRREVLAAVEALGCAVEAPPQAGENVLVTGGKDSDLVAISVPNDVSAEQVRGIDGVLGVYANPKIEPFSMAP